MDQQYIIGRNPVLEILKSDKEIEKILILKGDLKGSISKIVSIAKDRNIPIQQVDKNKLDNLAKGGSHQGVAALTSSYTYSSIEDILSKAEKLKESPFVVLLDGIEDPHNLGAIIRTAECAGVHGVIIPKRRAAQVTVTVYKSSAGAVEHMLVAKVSNLSNTIDILKEKGLWVYGADVDGENYYFDMNFEGPIALVIGSEGKGLSRLVKEKCDFLVKIPMFGNVSSLNASNAASILIYEVVEQNHEQKR
ncbi:23S rRNA (guanosine(2251)-2'-O)-methyltransferase RlmB [Tepidimicrobium xylanilyticum]|uniref:23S rRNA (Guanosine2251-2'-O)-methyltransferase n=1 Tax=Tepidimicrobium xylanilyticum TaxID=1123352 RepID=A0A1H3D2Q0_9FIRM|nr:23S rRNA (guanosine(2251)-2'-O)-methyltransferase RlmB [Tepidimicrobium xylanilyticum]GMG97890.1 23S rRNA (guanosine(2251)-2'-O)-methyltransferase RlmB [Tepidimicrobium xylanilyticum]SDX60645.1 23S rRNA (guanosine2251-2'-O)-methyltransferase [Tepidimicrobium xylanilyticum]